MPTKELILHTATHLFNQFGTAKITTNHIAKEAGISPGNLYYHYQDKSHIIREIYEQMIQDWEKAYQQVEGNGGVTDGTLQRFIEANFELLWQYRFFYRETVALLNTDPVLAKRHFEVTKTRIDRQRTFLQKAVEEGWLHFPKPEVQLDEVLTVAWIVANHYLVYLESMGQKVEESDFKTGAALVIKVFSPYLI